MKLVIQIPAYNEADTLVTVLKELPKTIPGVDTIETLLVDDGSGDDTIEVAQKYGIDHIVTHTGNRGLWEAFKSGVEKALIVGADILVNTDADNQYPGKYIYALVQPILERKADMVLGDRQTSKIEHFSPLKRFLQWFGSYMVRQMSQTKVPDSVSGFRAYSKEALLRLNVTSTFSYAVDTLIQAGSKGLHVSYIPIETNAPTRPSRLFSSMWQHVFKTTGILLRVYVMYHPIRVFFRFGLMFFFIGMMGIGRFLYFYIQHPVGTGKIQSLVLAGVCVVIAVQFFALWIIGDLIAKNRKLIEDDLYYTKKQYFSSKN